MDDRADRADFEAANGTDEDTLGWHVISGIHMLEVMRRCSEGESPDLVFAELWANAKRETCD